MGTAEGDAPEVLFKLLVLEEKYPANFPEARFWDNFRIADNPPATHQC